jgi:hypothetical protein
MDDIWNDYNPQFEPRADREAFYMAALLHFGANESTINIPKQFHDFAREHLPEAARTEHDAIILLIQYITWLQRS